MTQNQDEQGPKDQRLMERLLSVAVSPITWLTLVQVCMLISLRAVGYLTEMDAQSDVKTVAGALSGEVDIVARRAALAYSGVTLAITVLLSITSAVWAGALLLRWGAAFRGEDRPRPWYRAVRWPPVLWALVLAISFFSAVSFLSSADCMHPFPSRWGKVLLQLAQPHDPTERMTVDAGQAQCDNGAATGPSGSAGAVPTLMFTLAFVVPTLLAMAASALLPKTHEGISKDRIKRRLRELDHLLYIGGMALVFGTLQLSAAMLVPLASFPKSADIKNELEMCKAFGRASTVEVKPPHEQAATSHAGSVLDECHKLPDKLNANNAIESLRQLVRSVTLSTGLAFSALLVAIYVPCVVRLKLAAEAPEDAGPPATFAPLTLHGTWPFSYSVRPDAGTASNPKDETDTSDFDPVKRIAGLAAALSPLVASLVANAFAGG